jgi:hypothetical protein
MYAFTTRVPQRRPSGLRGGIIIGLALALVGAAVGTATGAVTVTPFQLVVVKNTADEPIPVVGTVSVSNTPSNQQVTVSNFPATQAVSGTVTVGNLPAGPLATRRFTIGLSTGAFSDGESTSVSFSTMNVTAVIVADGNDDNYDIGIGGFKLVANHEGSYSQHFTAAFPSSGVSMTCRNSVDECDVTVTILGY